MPNAGSAADQFGQRRCVCAQVVYRNRADGTRDYKLRGNMLCMVCRGSGMTMLCAACQGAGMVPGNTICSKCAGHGMVPFAWVADA